MIICEILVEKCIKLRLGEKRNFGEPVETSNLRVPNLLPTSYFCSLIFQVCSFSQYLVLKLTISLV